MTFLVDAQLPPALARAITESRHVATHVADAGLLHATDEAIWQYAANNGAVLVTKDEDFAVRHRRGNRNVRVVWLRIGNTSRAALLKRFLPLLPRIVSLLESGEVLIEIR